MSTVHIPILVEPIVDALVEPLRRLGPAAPARWIVDCTFGGGGHSAALLAALSSDPSLARHKVLGIDQDPEALERARSRFARELTEGRLELVHARFGDAGELIGERPVLGLLADLGFSSDQIESAERGLSFAKEGPLDMRLDPTSGRSAREILAQVTGRELQRLLSELGEERFSGRIADAIVESRRAGKLPRTTTELAELVVRAVPGPARHGRIHPATRTFQALRIAVNDELKELDRLLKDVILEVQPGGTVAIISFHSLEDRRVKNAFREHQAAGLLEIHTKKPIEADENEISRNPRSRSAKLRIARRI